MFPLKIAIIGGGIAGTTLANGLISLSSLHIDVYEAGPAFKEIGASVGLNGPCQQALSLISPDVRRTIDRAGGVTCLSTRLMVGCGPSQGERIVDISEENPSVNVHRAEFLNELLEPVPKDRLHVNKKLVGIEEEEDGTLRLRFADGTDATADAVVGCDGIHSAVRAFVLGKGHVELEPRPAGFWDFRNLVPVEVAREKLGEEWFDADEPRQFGWVGDGALLLHQLIDGGRTAAFIVAVRAEEDDGVGNTARWKSVLTRERLERALGDRGEFGKGAADCLMMAEQPMRFSQWCARKAPTYVKGRVVMIGDAAHATTPWHASGAGFAIEDAAMLSKLMGEVKGKEGLGAAFEVFDAVRRPRTQRLVESSLVVGKTFTGGNEDVGLNWGKMAQVVPRMWDFIYDYDIVKEAEEAAAMLAAKMALPN